ncbi:unnamed protein product [Prunus armeniaca]|uniref:Uncharacterized protein n=1 Tax=Prunus armeniaca TaxID=36596 RepID=A0A6J5UE97_PRUAR|nr:unnamed protein product [Prunus armeniaca]
MLLSYLKSHKEKVILMAGLTSAGKTTILNKIHTEEVLTEILTFEMLSHPYTSIAAFNVGGENIDEWRDASVLLIVNKNSIPDAMTIA